MLKSNLNTEPKIFTSNLETIGGNGGGGGGEDGATFIPIPTTLEVNKLHLAWTNNKGLPNPTPVDIVAPMGEKGDKGDKGDSGTSDHSLLSNRELADQHPVSAILGLQEELASKQPTGDYATNQDIDIKLEDKVDKITGKQLSANDYTDIEKAKLEMIDFSSYYTKTEADNEFAKANVFTTDKFDEWNAKTSKAYVDKAIDAAIGSVLGGAF